MSNNFQKGSEWRKWDLHIHTPFTKLNNQYSVPKNQEVWNIFCQKIEESDVSVFGITDYFSCENYFKFIKSFKEKYPNSNKVFFPNIEFRIDSKNSKEEHIQIHILFTNQIKQDKLEKFLSRLPLISTDDINLTSKYCNDKDLLEVGYDKAMVSFQNLREQLGKDFFYDKYLIVGVANGYGSLRPEKGDGRGAEYAKEIDKICNAFFGTNDNVDFYLNKIEGRSQYNLLPKPILLASDCHSFDDFDKKSLKYFTWIKADPTFEGLKQILYEPEERVKIQENNPEYDFDKPTFSKIVIRDEIEIIKGEKVKFNKIDELPLNKNLVTIIGGRGTGKSLLLNYIANIFNKEILAYKNKERQVTFNDSENFIVEWQKNNKSDPEVINFNSKDKGNLDFIFIEQGKLKNISDANILANEIKKLLGIEKLQFNEKLDNEISQLLNEIDEIKKWVEYENEKGEKVNSKELNESKRNEAEKLLETITTKENKEQLERYTLNIQKISSVDKIINQSEELKKRLSEFAKDTNEVINNINSKIQEDRKDTKIPFVDFQTQLDTINNIKNELEKIKQTKTDDNNEIRKKFEEQGFKGDLTSLLSNAEKYQKDIQEAKSKLEEIKNKKELLNEKIEQRNKLGQKLKEEYERQKNEINDAWQNLLNKFTNEQKRLMNKILEDRNISINGLIYFDKIKFDVKLKDYLDQRTYKNLSADLSINNLNDYWKFIENELSKYIKGEGDNETLKTIKQSLEEVFLTLKERRDYLYVLPEIKYMDKTLDQLSVGQRGTLYLLLQLATNAFSSPLIFDQPEDDLDNAFITNELVVLFKDLKKYRQIIISTHNANLVVTADAEQVIVANNEDEVLSYTSGSLENTTIIDNVCKILEGGKNAFEKRRNRYYSL